MACGLGRPNFCHFVSFASTFGLDPFTCTRVFRRLGIGIGELAAGLLDWIIQFCLAALSPVSRVGECEGLLSPLPCQMKAIVLTLWRLDIRSASLSFDGPQTSHFSICPFPPFHRRARIKSGLRPMFLTPLLIIMMPLQRC